MTATAVVVGVVFVAVLVAVLAIGAVSALGGSVTVALTCLAVSGWGLFVSALYRMGQAETVHTRLVDAYRDESTAQRKAIESQRRLIDALIAANTEKDLALEQISDCVGRHVLGQPVARKWLN